MINPLCFLLLRLYSCWDAFTTIQINFSREPKVGASGRQSCQARELDQISMYTLLFLSFGFLPLSLFFSLFWCQRIRPISPFEFVNFFLLFFFVCYSICVQIWPLELLRLIEIPGMWTLTQPCNSTKGRVSKDQSVVNWINFQRRTLTSGGTYDGGAYNSL